MKKPKRITLVLDGICAVVWTLRGIQSIVYRECDYAFGFYSHRFDLDCSLYPVDAEVPFRKRGIEKRQN